MKKMFSMLYINSVFWLAIDVMVQSIQSDNHKYLMYIYYNIKKKQYNIWLLDYKS